MHDRVEAFAAIWGKATGGRAVAVDPHLKDADAFSVPPAPGVQEACDWLREGLLAGSSPRMVFLVGGPGGGKSHALTRMTVGLDEEEAEDTGLAQRKYYFQALNSRLAVVNDASIRGGDDRHPLADDIDLAIRGQECFLGCVNRGILVEEAPALTEDSPGASVVRWLAGVDAAYTGDFPIVEVDNGPVIATATLQVSDSSIDVVAVFVDHCSLFETRPSISQDLHAEPYKVKRLAQRTNCDLSSMPAGALLSAVVRHLAVAEVRGPSGVDPLQANVTSLQAEVVRRGFLTILRSAEAVAGSRMTFREVWGGVLRGTAGDLPQESDVRELGGMFPPLDSELDAVHRFMEMRSRARLRMSESIFGVGVSAENRAVDPFLRFTGPVDPVLDAVPGWIARDEFGWASPVLDAFSGLITAVSPLQTVLGSVEADDPFHEVVTDFDHALDSAFVAVTQPEGIDDRARRDVIAWYGDYLSRLYALSNGVSAYRQEVSTWLATRSALPSSLKGELKTLLRPSRDPNNPQSGYVLPLFSSRTVPISGQAPEPQLVLQGEDDVHLELVKRGDAVAVEMRELGKSVGEIELDFALIRTALSCAGRRLGVTEQAARVSPRVERFRAKRLVPARIAESEFRLVVGENLMDVHVGG